MSAVRIPRGGGCIPARSQRETWRRRLSRPLRGNPKRLRLLAVPALRLNYQAQGEQTADRLRAGAKPTFVRFSTSLLCSARAVLFIRFQPLAFLVFEPIGGRAPRL